MSVPVVVGNPQASRPSGDSQLRGQRDAGSTLTSAASEEVVVTARSLTRVVWALPRLQRRGIRALQPSRRRVRPLSPQVRPYARSRLQGEIRFCRRSSLWASTSLL